ncbi:MAG: YceI family protein [Verrucomicrobiota bacterium]
MKTSTHFPTVVFTALLSILTISFSSQAETFTFDEKSTIGFVGSKVVGSHEGGFKKFTGSFELTEGEPKSGQFVIDMKSTWSDNDKLTGHLLSPDFFEVEAHPESKFVATKFEKKSEGVYHLSGDFTLRGVTKNITFPTAVKQQGDSATITAEFEINRQDFGITYKGMADNLIKDKVVIKLNLIAKTG